MCDAKTKIIIKICIILHINYLNLKNVSESTLNYIFYLFIVTFKVKRLQIQIIVHTVLPEL